MIIMKSLANPIMHTGFFGLHLYTLYDLIPYLFTVEFRWHFFSQKNSQRKKKFVWNRHQNRDSWWYAVICEMLGMENFVTLCSSLSLLSIYLAEQFKRCFNDEIMNENAIWTYNEHTMKATRKHQWTVPHCTMFITSFKRKVPLSEECTWSSW